MRAALLLLLLGALAAFAVSWRGRTAQLRRLETLVHAPASLTQADRGLASETLALPLVRNLRVLGLAPTPRDLMLGIAAFVIAAILLAMFHGLLAALGLAASLLLVGLGLLNVMAARRVSEIAAAMPTFLDRVRQLLSIGTSLPVAFERASHDAPPKLARLLSPAIRRIGNGGSFADSLQQSAQDIDLHEMRLFVTAVTVNTRFGGSLTQSLANLVAYLRKRASIERELRSSTAQIRASAWVLGLLPLGVAAMIFLQNPRYADWFLSDPSGRWMLAYCIMSQIVGAALMRLIVRTAY